MGTKCAYWPKHRGKSQKLFLPKAPWVLIKIEQIHMKGIITAMKTPTRYMHNFKGEYAAIEKLSGLKSHDWHKMLQVLL